MNLCKSNTNSTNSQKWSLIKWQNAAMWQAIFVRTLYIDKYDKFTNSIVTDTHADIMIIKLTVMSTIYRNT